MDLASLVKLAILLSLLLIVFALGLRATFADATYLFRTAFQQPHRLLRAAAAMFIVVPTIAVAIAKGFDLPQPVKVALLAMAVSPMPPILPGKQLKFGGQASFVYGLLVAVSLVSIVVVPAWVEVLAWLFDRDTHVGPEVVAKSIGVSILAPLVAGLLVRRFAERAAERIAPWASRIGMGLLVVGALLILVRAWPAVTSLVGGGAIVAFVAIAAIGVAVGHVLAGPDPRDQAVLAIATPVRHPGVALAIAHAALPTGTLASAAILLLLLTGVIATSIYGKVRFERLSS